MEKTQEVRKSIPLVEQITETKIPPKNNQMEPNVLPAKEQDLQLGIHSQKSISEKQQAINQPNKSPEVLNNTGSHGLTTQERPISAVLNKSLVPKLPIEKVQQNADFQRMTNTEAVKIADKSGVTEDKKVRENLPDKASNPKVEVPPLAIQKTIQQNQETKEVNPHKNLGSQKIQQDMAIVPITASIEESRKLVDIALSKDPNPGVFNRTDSRNEINFFQEKVQEITKVDEAEDA